MTTPSPPPVPPPIRRTTWRLLASLCVAVVIVLGALYVLTRDRSDRTDQIRSQDLSDPSLDFDEPRQAHEGVIIENGRAYTQAKVPLAGAKEVVLGEDRETKTLTVRTDGPAGEVGLLIEKRLHDFSFPAKTYRLRDFSDSRKVWARRMGDVLVIDVDGGASHRHGGSTIHAIVILSKDTHFAREAASSPHFLGRGRTPEDEANAAAWAEVRQQPLPKTEWPLPIERPAPMNLPR